MLEELEDKSDAFSLAIALYYWLSHWHEGQHSEKYAALSRLVSVHKLEVRGEMEEDDKMRYGEISERNWKDTFKTLEKFLEERWDDE